MGLIRKAFFFSAFGTTGVAAYLAAKNPIISPLAATDAIWKSSVFRKYNPSANPATQDVCIKRIPIDKIRPELIKNPSALTLEYCRGVWSGVGFEVQRRYLEWKYSGPETAHNLWSRQQLAESNYDKGTCIVEHFEVVEKTNTSITVRCGDSPRKQEPRPSDGLFVIGAVVDEARGEVELTLKSCLFSSQGKVDGIKGPMPTWMEELHQWYARIWSETGSRKLLK
ncbi:hypothetical protein K4F52_004711 [Lecanicillium sp. MT-2017a]|nr:hypothetical protein K4F52_004711 [Lecanicillium sp. MT-2017a]